MTVRGLPFEGRSADFSDLPFDPVFGVRRVRVTQAVNRDVLGAIAGMDPAMSDDALAVQIRNFTANARIEIVSHGEKTTLTYGNLLIATLELT
jgi:hypothetical protein